MELEKSVRFSEQRGNCKCPQLEELWGQMKKVDEAEEDAREYAEEYVKNQEKYRQDIIFMRALSKRTEKFNSQIYLYQDIFLNRVKEGSIIFEVNEKAVNPEEISEDQNHIMRCASCGTEIRRLKYPGWNE